MYAIHALLMLPPIVHGIGEIETCHRQPFGPLMCEQFCQRTRDCSSFYFSAALLSCQLRDRGCQVMPAPDTFHMLKKLKTNLRNTCSRCKTDSQGRTTARRCAKNIPSGYQVVKYGKNVMLTRPRKEWKTWDGALRACERDGGSLLQPSTKAYERRILRKYRSFFARSKNGTAWIGLTDVRANNTFSWVDGTCPTHTNWGKGEPSHVYQGRGEHCVIYRAGKWFDSNCQIKLPFLCQICYTPYFVPVVNE